MPEDGLAGTCLLPDAQPLSLGAGNTQREPGGGHALVSERLHDPIEPPAEALWARVSGRYKALIVDGSGNGYLRTVGRG